MWTEVAMTTKFLKDKVEPSPLEASLDEMGIDYDNNKVYYFMEEVKQVGWEQVQRHIKEIHPWIHRFWLVEEGMFANILFILFVWIGPLLWISRGWWIIWFAAGLLVFIIGTLFLKSTEIWKNYKNPEEWKSEAVSEPWSGYTGEIDVKISQAVLEKTQSANDELKFLVWSHSASDQKFMTVESKLTKESYYCEDWVLEKVKLGPRNPLVRLGNLGPETPASSILNPE
jgi:hypothetical protein